MRTLRHRDRNGTIQRHDRRWLKQFQKPVELDDLRPVRIFGLAGLTVQGGDGSLQ